MKRALAFLALCIAVQAQTAPAPGNVTLPLDEYNKLVELAARPPKKSDAPPVPHVLKSTHMNLQVKGESVSGTIAIEGEVLASGNRKVPLVTGMIIVDARQAGKELALEQEGGAHSALLSGPGDFSVTLETAIPLNIEPGRASFNLPVPASGAARLTLSVPGDQTLVNLNPGVITGRSSANGRTIIEATLVPGQPANLWWAARLNGPVAPFVPKEIRFLSDIKTLISVSEAELGLAALAEVTVVQGEPAQFEIQAPDGYELTGATGPTLISTDVQPKSILLKVSNPEARSHEFLISVAKTNMAPSAEIPLITFNGSQRETGEVLIEGDGAVELTATERGGLRRMDLKETSPYLRSLARSTLHAAFRYQRRPSETPAVALEWTRFPDGKVLAAVAQQATVTTLVTSEGRSLTEVKLTLKNQSQPFLKVDLPAGATILSADVAGEKVKPVTGADGNRVPLLRPGFRPTDSYTISYVFLHAGVPFTKKGDAELALPKMDIPIGRVEWEVFLPERYKVADFGGDAISALAFPGPGEDIGEEALTGRVSGGAQGMPMALAMMTPSQPATPLIEPLGPGQIGGYIQDPAGAVVGNAPVIVTHRATGQTFRASSDPRGSWMVSNVPSGPVSVRVSVAGFKAYVREFNYDAGRPYEFSIRLDVGSASESISVTAAPSLLKTESGTVSSNTQSRPQAQLPDTTASANVADLQRRIAGVLPIAVSVPRTGASYRFIRPLVVDEETKLTFKYRSR